MSMGRSSSGALLFIAEALLAVSSLLAAVDWCRF